MRSIIRHYFQTRARLQCVLRGVAWPDHAQFLGPVAIANNGKMILGSHLTVCGDSRFNRAGIAHPTQLVTAPGAELVIGDHVGISGSTLYAFTRIEVGNHVNIGVDCHIFDGDFHALDWRARRDSATPECAPVHIEDDVWLAAKVTVLKGVRIGARSIVGAGSVVTRDVPSDSLVAGNPARIVRHLDRD